MKKRILEVSSVIVLVALFAFGVVYTKVEAKNKEEKKIAEEKKAAKEFKEIEEEEEELLENYVLEELDYGDVVADKTFKKVTYSIDIQNIVVKTTSYNISFKTSKDDKIYVKNNAGTNDILYGATLDTLYITDTDKISSFGGKVNISINIGSKKKNNDSKNDIVIYIPEGYTGHIACESVSGDVSMNETEAFYLTVKTTSGNINFDKLDVACSIRFMSVSGDVYGTFAKRKDDYRIDMKSKSGEVNNENNCYSGTIPIVIRTTSGDISTIFAK